MSKQDPSLRALAGLIEDGYLCSADHAALLYVLARLPELPASLCSVMKSNAALYSNLGEDNETVQASDAGSDEMRDTDAWIGLKLYETTKS